MADWIWDFLEGALVTVVAAAVGAAICGVLMYAIVMWIDPAAGTGFSLLERSTLDPVVLNATPAQRAWSFAVSFGVVGGAAVAVMALRERGGCAVGKYLVFLALIAWSLFLLFYASAWIEIFHGPVLATPIVFGWGAAVAGVAKLFERRRGRQ
jgi:hypothetical protein